MHGSLQYFQVQPDTPRHLCIPYVPELRNDMIFEEHDTAARGHPGQTKTLLLLLEKYYWRGMASSIQRYVASYEPCQRIKYIHGKPAELLHPLDIPDQRWADIAMDFMTQLTLTASGHDVVMVIVDRLRNVDILWLLVPVRQLQTWFVCFATFFSMYIDCQKPLFQIAFTSKLWQQIIRLHGTRLRLSTAFVPSALHFSPPRRPGLASTTSRDRLQSSSA